MTTLVLAMLIMLLVAVSLGIGLILTGKSRLKKRCGWTPGKKEDDSCGLCGKHKKCDEDESDAH